MIGAVIDLLQSLTIVALLYVVHLQGRRINLLEPLPGLPEGASPVPDNWIEEMLQQLNAEAGDGESA